MSEFLARQQRKIARASTLTRVAIAGLWQHRRLPHDAPRTECARWLHEACARALRDIGLQLHIEGHLPTRGLIVSNHLSYLDILVYSAAVPCVFVSKAEVERLAHLRPLYALVGQRLCATTRPRRCGACQCQHRRRSARWRAGGALPRRDDNGWRARSALSLDHAATCHRRCCADHALRHWL